MTLTNLLFLLAGLLLGRLIWHRRAKRPHPSPFEQGVRMPSRLGERLATGATLTRGRP